MKVQNIQTNNKQSFGAQKIDLDFIKTTREAFLKTFQKPDEYTHGLIDLELQADLLMKDGVITPIQLSKLLEPLGNKIVIPTNQEIHELGSVVRECGRGVTKKQVLKKLTELRDNAKETNNVWFSRIFYGAQNAKTKLDNVTKETTQNINSLREALKKGQAEQFGRLRWEPVAKDTLV